MPQMHLARNQYCDCCAGDFTPTYYLRDIRVYSIACDVCSPWCLLKLAWVWRPTLRLPRLAQAIFVVAGCALALLWL